MIRPGSPYLPCDTASPYPSLFSFGHLMHFQTISSMQATSIPAKNT